LRVARLAPDLSPGTSVGECAAVHSWSVRGWSRQEVAWARRVVHPVVHPSHGMRWCWR
jgi:hypothetical protein